MGLVLNKFLVPLVGQLSAQSFGLKPIFYTFTIICITPFGFGLLYRVFSRLGLVAVGTLLGCI